MTDAPQLPPLPRVIYGIWLPGTGWLKAHDGKIGAMVAYAEVNRDVAQRYADWIGNGARIEPIDPSLVALERELLRYEKERRERPRMAWNMFIKRVKTLRVWIGRIWTKKQKRNA